MLISDQQVLAGLRERANSANLRLANLELANLELANLELANLELANLELANLELANLELANLELANLELANLELANLELANLEPSVMTVMLIKWIFVILHVITAAAWFGLGLRLGGQARAVTNAKPTAAKALADDVAGSVRLMNIFVVLTLVFGLCAFFAGGGFAAYGPVYHTSILLILVLAGIQLFMVRPAWGRLQSGAGSERATDALESARKRIAMSVGIGHLCWLVLLVLMFWKYLGAAF